MNKKTIVALSKDAFIELMNKKGITESNIERQTKIAFISINEPGDYRNLPFTEPHSNLLLLFFDDVSTRVPILNSEPRIFAEPFSEEQAMETIKFLKNNVDKELFIIHCTAGVSRSGAFAQFINEYFNQDTTDFVKDNPSIKPNSHVLNLLIRAYMAYHILYPPITNASITTYPDDSSNKTD